MIKKLFVTISVVFLTMSILGTVTLAHPGRTDSQGGHTCRTNCAKWGLKTGEYHYHNGGGSSSTAATKPAPPPAKPKPTYSQVDVDNGKDAGKSQGYEEGYSRKNKNTHTDSGNEGYKKGYIEGYEAGYAEGLKKIKEEDILAGTTSGEEKGRIDYQDGKNKEVSPDSSKSEEWNSAYKTAFIHAFDREKLIDDSGKLGNELGYSLEELVVPTNLATDETLQEAFKSQYKKGYEKRMTEEKAKHIEIGVKDGFSLSDLAIESIDKKFIDFYKEGYEDGMSKRKEEILAEGYQSSFINMDYKEVDSYDNQQLNDWHKEGFESNDIAVQIKEIAFENGHTNSKYFIPKEFEINNQSIALYDNLFQQGQELRAKEKQQKMMYAAGIGIPAGGIVAGGLLFRKKRSKKAS